MTQRVTDFRIDTVEIDEEKFYRLPDKTQDLIRAYASPLKAIHDGYMRFEIPVYRWQEIEASMKGLTGK